MLLDWILANKEILKIFYGLLICFICALIVIKTDRLFKISDYQGLRYFRNSFFFYGVAFFTRFILGAIPTIKENSICFINVYFLFEFFMIVAGLFLLYSFIWKFIEKEKNHHSFFNVVATVFYVVAFLIASLNFLLNTSIFMYLSQVILFLLMGLISYKNFKAGSDSYRFLKYYFIVIVLGLIAWILNASLEYFLEWNKIVQIGVYGLTGLFFVFFIYVITKITGGRND